MYFFNCLSEFITRMLLIYHTNWWFFVAEQLDELRQLVRSPLSRTGRQILSALIVIEVHARDVVGNMLAENVSDVNDFEWISQLRLVRIVSYF